MMIIPIQDTKPSIKILESEICEAINRVCSKHTITYTELVGTIEFLKVSIIEEVEG